MAEERVKSKATPLGLSEGELLDNRVREGRSEPQTPRETSAQRFVESAKPLDVTPAKEHPGAAVPSGPTTATTTVQQVAPSKRAHITAEEKEHEKEKLKALVHEFAKRAATEGIVVDVISPATGGVAKYLFEMDKYLMWFTLTLLAANPSHSPRAEQPAAPQQPGEKRQYMMTTVTFVCKGRDISAHLPDATSLPVPLSDCVLVDSDAPDARLFFVFPDAHERRKFYTCLKIIRMSVAISRNKQSGKTAG